MTTMTARALIAFAALLIAVATGLGAYASHGLDTVLDARALGSFETAVQYQFIHSLGLIGVAIYGERHREANWLSLAGWLLAVGIILFCGGVYASSLDGPGWLSSVAPAGGIGLIGGWLVVAITIARGISRREVSGR
jgi:uncharacterized membrane protein YgdD (TMEM256/DUF423 family)